MGGLELRLVEQYPQRVGYVHLKQVDPVVLAHVREKNLTWAAANRAQVMVEPPAGAPDLTQVIAAVQALNRPLFGVVEQDMYPCEFDKPLPIARRTREYLLGCICGSQASAGARS